jgi:cytochrome c oxidase subunit 1
MRPFSLDHKVIGLQYAVTSMIFLLIGFSLMLLMRWQLAYPGSPIPVIGSLLGPENAPSGIMAPELYNQLAAMHGTIMIFLGVVPLGVGAFGNYLIPLMIGAPEMAFPRLNMASYWLYAVAGVVMVGSFFLPSGAPDSGWTSYPPLAVLSLASGQTCWLAGMVLLASSALLGSINTIVTIVQLRTPGMKFMRLPFFVWAQLVTAFLLLLAFPSLQAASLMQLMDRTAGTSFFMPSGLVVNASAVPYAGGGNPLLWQHLFWFLAHPEVYVLILPALGIVAEVLAASIRKPLWGYRVMVYASIFLGFMSMLVWAHHMFLTGMGTTMSAFFQLTTMIVSVPSVVILTALLMSLHGGSIRFTTPALFALAFLPMFGIGGLTGLPLGLAASDIHLHDTYYVVGHFHYIVAPGTIFALFAGVYHWLPRVAGRRLNERLGKVHFWGSFVCMNLVFFPMFIQGLAGLNRRLYDGGVSYTHGQAIQHWNVLQGWAAWGLALFQIVFLVNLLFTLMRRREPDTNPWKATTLEWFGPPGAHAAPAGSLVRVYRGPYEYSIPDADDDYLPQHVPAADARAATLSPPPPIHLSRPDTGTSGVSLGMWLFIASEVMLFGALFSAYVLLRSSGDWRPGSLAVEPAIVNTILLLVSSMVFVAARSAAVTGQIVRTRVLLAIVGLLGVAFLGIKGVEYWSEASAGFVPATSTFWAVYYLLTSIHAAHLAAGILVIAHAVATADRQFAADRGRYASRITAVSLYWHFVDIVWLCLFVALYML